MNARFSFLALLLALTLTSSPVGARYQMGKKKPIPKRDRTYVHQARPQRSGVSSATSQFSEGPVIGELSQQFDVDVNRLEYLRGLRYGYELLVPALVVAKEADIDVGRVLKRNLEGASWEKICDDFLVDTKFLDKQALAVLDPLRKKVPKELMLEKPRRF